VALSGTPATQPVFSVAAVSPAAAKEKENRRRGAEKTKKNNKKKKKKIFLKNSTPHTAPTQNAFKSSVFFVQKPRKQRAPDSLFFARRSRFRGSDVRHFQRISPLMPCDESQNRLSFQASSPKTSCYFSVSAYFHINFRRFIFI
jgi:hypothetical protein